MKKLAILFLVTIFSVPANAESNVTTELSTENEMELSSDKIWSCSSIQVAVVYEYEKDERCNGSYFCYVRDRSYRDNITVSGSTLDEASNKLIQETINWENEFEKRVKNKQIYISDGKKIIYHPSCSNRSLIKLREVANYTKDFISCLDWTRTFDCKKMD